MWLFAAKMNFSLKRSIDTNDLVADLETDDCHDDQRDDDIEINDSSDLNTNDKFSATLARAYSRQFRWLRRKRFQTSSFAVPVFRRDDKLTLS